MPLPEESHEPQPLGHGIVDLVLGVPVVHLFPLAHGLLLEELDHLHGLGVCGTDHLPEDAGAQTRHAYGVA